MFPVNQLLFSRFDESIFPIYYAPVRALGSTRMYRMNAAQATPMSKEAKAVTADVAIGAFDVVGNDETAEEVSKTEESTEQKGPDQIPVRENLNETAFCYPALHSSNDGSVTLSFTLPESLTTWRFMGIANTVDMLYGYIDGEAIAQKDVMVQPNMPRFIREGDKATIAARLFNTTDHSVSGTSLLQLIDPTTDKVVYEQSAPFAMDANGSTTVTFVVNGLPVDLSLFICKVTARGDGFSDGEQHYLPVLSNREYVTKTVPITQHEAGTKAIDLTKLFPQGTDQQKLTIEYTNNPAWLMVQSLPTLGQPAEHSAIDQAAAYYSNILAKYLLDQSPQTKQVFEQWKQEQGSETSLQAQLAKDEELKDIILQETPWVAAADRESEQRQRLADFFDENSLNYRLQTIVEKLKALQNADGSFSWYPGMEGSTYITVAVEEMLARLQRLSPLTSNLSPLYDNAFRYLSKKVVDLVAKMKKEEKKGHRQTFPTSAPSMDAR